MAVLTASVLTLMDWAKRLGPDGKIPTIVELLSQVNEILVDMMWKEGNLPTGERTVVRTGLPQVFWRLLNQGVQPSKSLTAQIDEGTGMLEGWSEVDKDLALLNGDVSAFRLSEASAYLEAMNQQFTQTLFYGNSSVNPEQFNGFSIRYGAISGAGNAQNIIDAAGTGSVNTSVWIVSWGANTVQGIFPKGSVAGLKHDDLGEQTIETTNGVGGSRMRAFQDHFQWKCGLALKDWRYVVRIANIDITNLTTEASAADLTKSIIRGLNRIPNLGVGSPVIYMNRTVFEMLDIQRLNNVRSGGQLSFEVVDGKRIPMFRGVPIRIVDALINAEARVV